ncbi:hypothetical protein BO78DRAFT_392728 [Aspergillus sclerotiicarbonarius CBS 121057]|uniref:Uncharacterized protein n=1 Tax=Aspergillus sclerotiicarbonarius (strain CBS 121057 / IBT 28362) TaxID=1448318 RepID=A0A319EUT7_ASPSB|nr:hypothetical protein BO78DRAFT_392728 [Aspergillus sclerotiicarbonarius CBS 121057]
MAWVKQTQLALRWQFVSPAEGSGVHKLALSSPWSARTPAEGFLPGNNEGVEQALATLESAAPFPIASTHAERPGL